MRAPDFWTRASPTSDALGAVLAPIGALYGFSVRFKAARAHPHRPKARVVCVGNLTAGGSGKTPIAIAIGRMLAARGVRAVFLTRGYGGRLKGPVKVEPSHSAADVGDEPLLLAATAPTVVSRDRKAGAELADALGADIIVMDDGFQNFQIEKDLSFVVVDAAAGFGNGRLIPAGPLREPAADGLARADVIVLAGQGEPQLPPFAGATLRAELIATTPEVVFGRHVVAFAAIGRPAKFFATLRGLGATIVTAQGFADHHRFAAWELATLKAAAERAGALLVTTEKDYARIAPDLRTGIVPVPVHAVFTETAVVSQLLDRLIERRIVGS